MQKEEVHGSHWKHWLGKRWLAAGAALAALLWSLRRLGRVPQADSHGQEFSSPPPYVAPSPMASEPIPPTPVTPPAIEPVEPAAPAVEAAPAPAAPSQTRTPAMESAESAPAAEASASADGAGEPDDLEIIEGIGPRIAGELRSAGIASFAELAGSEIERLTQVLRDAALPLANPASWAGQARLAAEGKWDELKELQANLKGGRTA